MNYPCSVICDLLPLVEEGLASEESAAAVREHLAGCAACREKREALRQPGMPTAESAAPMKELKKELRRRRWRTAAIAALAVFVVLFALLARATNETPLPYSPELVRVEGVEFYDPDAEPAHSGALIFSSADDWQSAEPGQALVISRNERVSAVKQECYLDEDTGEMTVYLQYFSTDLNLLVNDLDGSFSVERPEGSPAVDLIYPVPDRVIYGFGEKQELLWGEPMNGGMQILPRLALAFYVLLAAALSVLFAILWLVLRRRPCGGALRQIGFAPLSYLLAQLLVKGGETSSLFLLRDLLLIAVEAAVFYALLTLACFMLRQRRADRAG